MKMETINMQCHFKMKDGKEEIIDPRHHGKTLDLMNDIPENLPS